MQSRKSDADVDSICEICPSLSASQILKLIKSYTSDDCEDAISPTFIDKLTKKLCAVSFPTLLQLEPWLFQFIIWQPENETFTMNENEVRPLSVIFKYTDVKLEDVEIPDVLKLNGIVNKI